MLSLTSALHPVLLDLGFALRVLVPVETSSQYHTCNPRKHRGSPQQPTVFRFMTGRLDHLILAFRLCTLQAMS